MKKILFILIIIALGTNYVAFENYKTISKMQPKTITKIVYLESKQSKKNKDDLQILVKINNKMHILFTQVFNYEELKNSSKGTKTTYEFDLWYLEQSIKNTKF